MLTLLRAEALKCLLRRVEKTEVAFIAFKPRVNGKSQQASKIPFILSLSLH